MEIRIVLLGKPGTGKSATGNTIIGEKSFHSSASDLFFTRKCLQKRAVRFGRNVLVVDTPGIFGTRENNEEIQKEICKCIPITSPGPHAFILVLRPSRYTVEEQKTVEHYVKYFGEKLYNYLIILFTRKDDLDYDGVKLMDKLKTVSVELKALITKCDGRVIAFNNLLKGEQQNAQVTELLSMILKNIKSNDGGCYTNEMYLEAEKQIRKTEEEMKIKAAMKLKKEYEENMVKEEIIKEYLNERKTISKALRMEVKQLKTGFEHLKKEFEPAEVQHEDDFVTMAVNTAKS